jgi:hypothetical protein
VKELFEASLRFPTVVFTIGLGIVLVYWLFVFLGALDIDLLGGGEVHGDGIGDALGGHGHVDVGGHDVGGHDVGGHDVGGHDAGGHDASGDGHDADGGDGFFAKLGLGAVPLTISVSFIMLVGWTTSLLASSYIDGGAWLPYVLLPAVLVTSMLVTSVLVRPLAPVFKVREGKKNKDWVGQTCTISTGTVDEKFGHANVEEGGTTMDIAVRCDAGKLGRGDKALIIDFDEERQAYLVEPVASILPNSKAGEPS